MVSRIEKAHQVAGTRVTESVLGRQLDKFNALYYLTLKSMQPSNPEISLFKKQKRSSLVKLEPISRTPLLKAKPTQEYLLSLKTGPVNSKRLSQPRLRLTFDARTRCRNREQPDSPRRLLDCLAAYKQC